MSDRKLTPIAKELIVAKARIADPENWCSEDGGRDPRPGRNGHRVCALLALGGFEATSDDSPQYQLLRKSARGLFNTGIISVNALGHSAVMRMYDHAISKALSEGK